MGALEEGYVLDAYKRGKGLAACQPPASNFPTTDVLRRAIIIARVLERVPSHSWFGTVGLVVLRDRNGHFCTELPWKGPG